MQIFLPDFKLSPCSVCFTFSFQDFLAKNYVTTVEHPPNYVTTVEHPPNYVATVEHPPNSPGLVQTDFELLSRLKSALKRRNFCDGADIIKNAMEELKRLSQNDLQECFNINFCQSLEEVCIFIGRLF
jgi:hypothetical protein